jgi:hypothetical protein
VWPRRLVIVSARRPGSSHYPPPIHAARRNNQVPPTSRHDRSLRTRGVAEYPQVDRFAPQTPNAKPATYPNGRILTDDVYSLRFAWLSNGKIRPTGLKPHDNLLAHFPYLGPPTPSS